MKRIGICHRFIMIGDAVSNDILGTYNLLTKMGFSCWLLGEFIHESIQDQYQVGTNLNQRYINDQYDLLIYHHSIFWEDGEHFLSSFTKPIIIKFHSITPPYFFESYSHLYVDNCQKGIDQISSLAKISNVRLWQADSLFNLIDLKSCGISEKTIKIVPPFNRVNVLMKKTNSAFIEKKDIVQILFIGRHTPGGGHLNLLIVLAMYCVIFSDQVLLKIVFNNNGLRVKEYYQETEQLIFKLGLSKKVDIISHIRNQEELDDLFLSSHVYLNINEKEGFCVPIIEAQAAGLPVITVGACGLNETTGPNQVVLPYPIIEEDFELYARAIHEIIINKELREKLLINGLKNVWERFSQEVLENLFISTIEPILRRLV